jgi:DNA-binding MurR/RpiR family transcriptional regulator
MTESELTQKIRNHYHKLSSTHKLIAEYILNNFEEAAFLTASRLGTLIGTSESTIIRFACCLGYNGYPELQEAMQDMLRNKLNTVTLIDNTSENANITPIFSEIFLADMDNLRKTFQEIVPVEFQKAVNEIANAPSIYILGMRTAYCIVLFLEHYLEMICKKVKVIPSGVSSIFEQLSLVDKKDIIIAISFPKYTKLTVDGVKYAKKKGKRIIAITDSVLSPLAQWADITLTSETKTGSFIQSFVAPLSLVNSLVIAVARQQKSQLLDSLKEREAICNKNKIFYPINTAKIEKLRINER